VLVLAVVGTEPSSPHDVARNNAVAAIEAAVVDRMLMRARGFLRS